MRKILALIIARNKEFYRDRGTMVWTLLFPFIVLTGFAYGISGHQDPILRIEAIATDLTAPSLKVLQQVPGVAIHLTSDSDSALKKLTRYQTDLVVETSSSLNRLVYSFNPDSDKGKLAERLLTGEVARLPEPRPTVESRTVSGVRIRYADWVLPGLLAMNIMFGSMFGVGYVIVRYRKNGVLKRLRATPLSAFQFLAAQVVSRVLLMVVTSLMVVAGAMVLIRFKPQGSWIDLALFLAVSAAAMISVGLMVAARISSEEAADNILNLMTWPMIFLSGIWFTLEGASDWVLFGSKLMPLTHVVDGLRAILIDGASLSTLIPQILILGCLSSLFIGIGSWIFRWR